VEARRFAVATDFFVAGRFAFTPVAGADGLFAPAAGAFAAFERARVFVRDVARRFAVVFAPLVAVAPDDTRVECFARCFTTFFGAASATEAAANATSSAARNTLRFRIMALR
jgi:hypothetical protein